MSEVREGDRVKIHYTGRLPDGRVFDSSEGRDPLEFTAGGREVIPGVSEAVVGMKEGEAKTVTVPPEKGYGSHDDRLVQSVPKSSLPEGADVGDQLRATGGGKEFTVWVREIQDEQVKLDANHPLAGETLEFELQLVEVQGA